MKTMRFLEFLVVAGAMVGLVGCGGGGSSSGGGGPGPAASTDFNAFVLSTLAKGDASEPIEVNDLVFDYADDDDTAFATVLAE